MSTDEVKKVRRDQRIKLHKFICFCGTGLITCVDKSDMLTKLSVYNRTAAYRCTLFFTISLVSMLLGIIASSFPDTAPFAMIVSWNGSLQAFLFAIAYLHLSAMEYFENVQNMFISFAFTSAVFIVFWYFYTKESSTVNNRDADGSERSLK